MKDNIRRTAGILLVFLAAFILSAVWRRADLQPDAIHWIVLIPPWLIAAVATAGLYLAGAWREKPRGLSLLPAAFLGLAWLFCSETPLWWGTLDKSSGWYMTAVGFLLLGYGLVESARALAAKQYGFHLKTAALYLLMLLLACLPAADGAVRQAIYDSVSVSTGAHTLLFMLTGYLRLALTALSGLTVLPYTRRAGNPFGWALVGMGAAGVLLFVLSRCAPGMRLGLLAAPVQDPACLAGFVALAALGARMATRPSLDSGARMR